MPTTLDQTTRVGLELTLALLNGAAKDYSRRGQVGTLTEEYERIHGQISALLYTWQTTPPAG